MVIFRWLFFSSKDTKLDREIAVISWLNSLILSTDLWDSSTQHQVKHVIDPLLNSSTLLQIHHAASNGFAITLA